MEQGTRHPGAQATSLPGWNRSSSLTSSLSVVFSRCFCSTEKPGRTLPQLRSGDHAACSSSKIYFRMHSALLNPSPAKLLSSSFLCQPALQQNVAKTNAQKFVRLSVDAQAERHIHTDVAGRVSRHTIVHQLAIAAAATPLLHESGALAVPSSTIAGRIPGLSEPDVDGICPPPLLDYHWTLVCYSYMDLR